MIKIIASIIILFAVTAVGFFVLWPKYGELVPLQEGIKEIEQNLQKEQEFYGELEEASGKLSGYPEALAKIEAGLPTDPSTPSFIDYLQKKSSESGLILRQFGKPAASVLTDNPRIKEYTLGVSLSGSYGALKNFLKEMEQSARIIEVQSISFSAGEKANTSVAFSLVLKIHSY